MLILDIFAQRARSREGKLQVELAQLRYRQANLIGSSASLSRLGGGIGSRGPVKRNWKSIDVASKPASVFCANNLPIVATQRSTRRGGGERDPLIALVGYTNVGKSSLLNRLARTEGSQQAFVANQPFATLDPTMRRIFLRQDLSARLVDTVGFITELPKELVATFRATLEELHDATLLLHVIDASNPDWPRQRASVEEILQSLDLSAKPVLLLANKIDAAIAPEMLPLDAIPVSAIEGEGLDLLRDRIIAILTPPAE